MIDRTNNSGRLWHYITYRSVKSLSGGSLPVGLHYSQTLIAVKFNYFELYAKGMIFIVESWLVLVRDTWLIIDAVKFAKQEVLGGIRR